MAYDVFGINGGGTTTTSPTYKTNSSTKNAGSNYDVFNIGSVQAVANPNKVAKTVASQQQQPQSSKPTSILSKIGTAAKDVAVGTKNFAEAGVKSAYDIGRGAAASGDIPGTKLNPTALANAHAAKATDFPAFAGPVFRPVVQAAEEIAHPTTQHSFTPTTKDQQELLGKAPIQNINKGVASTYQAQKAKGKSTLKSSLLAGLYGSGQVTQDALAVGGVKAGGLVDDVAHTAGKVKATIKTATGKDEAVNAALQTAKQNSLLDKVRPPESSTPAVEPATTVPNTIPAAIAEDAKVKAAAHDALNPPPQPVAPAEPVTPVAPELTSKEKLSQTTEAAKIGALSKDNKPTTLLPSQTKDLPEIGGYTHSSDFVKDYATMLKETDKTPKVDGAKPIDYTAEAQKELASGNAQHGASADYKQLVDREAKPTTEPVATTEQKANTDTSSGQASTPVEAAAPASKVTLTPSQTAHMPEIGGYTHSEHMANDYADMLRGQEQGVKGGQLIKQADGGYTRTSEHSPFYRAYFKEHGAVPTKAAYLEEAKLELESGKDSLGAAKDYQQLREREAQPIPRVQVDTSKLTDTKQITPMVSKRIAKDLKANYNDLATIDKVNLKDQADKAATLLQNRELLNKVISGEAPLPDGLRATSIVTALRPEFKTNPELLLKVANSPLGHESSLAGQEMRLARENAAHDPVFDTRKIQDARAAAFEAKNKTTAAKAVSTEFKAIRAAKVPVTPKTWNDFVESIKCH